MFFEREELNGSNDSQKFLDQESLLSQAQNGNGGEIYIQLNEKGHLKQGSRHIKATFDSDH